MKDAWPPTTPGVIPVGVRPLVVSNDDEAAGPGWGEFGPTDI